jgi:hypothetical protein
MRGVVSKTIAVGNINAACVCVCRKWSECYIFVHNGCRSRDRVDDGREVFVCRAFERVNKY